MLTRRTGLRGPPRRTNPSNGSEIMQNNLTHGSESIEELERLLELIRQDLQLG
jgi:hypothetical protein